MVTMKGYTSSLPFLLLLARLFGVDAATPGGEPAPTDYLPSLPFILHLPTSIGTFDKSAIDTGFGSFPKDIMNCGKASVTGNQLGTDYTEFSDMSQDCSPNPMRVVYTTDTNSNAFSSVGSPVDLSSCQGLQTCALKTDLTKTNLGDKVVDASAATILNPNKENDMCADASHQLLLSNEMGCANDATIPKPGDAPATDKWIAPRWKTGSDNLFQKTRAFMHTGLGRRNELKVIPRTNNFVDLPKSDGLQTGNVWKVCRGGCDQGDIVKFNMNQTSWRAMIYLKGKTKGFKMCIGAEDHDSDSAQPKCRSRFELFVLPRNGLVIWPKNGRASPIELKPAGVEDSENYAIEIGYGLKSDQTGEFYVANQFREMVASDTDGWSPQVASKVSFFFQSPDDLVKNAGIVSSEIQMGKTFIDKAKASSVVDKKVIVNRQGFTVTGKEPLVNKPDDPPIAQPLTTTPAPKRLSSNAHLGVLLQSTDHTNDAIFMPGKWWAWGLYIGFIIGSLVGVALLGGLFYLIRRTVYGFWYRGMYKRYGCDASGTTGGITGVGFGNTTTGAITVGGTTGAGATTAGTTRGGTTTGSTTGGGGTTGSMTSTGGASTIAM